MGEKGYLKEKGGKGEMGMVEMRKVVGCGGDCGGDVKFYYDPNQDFKYNPSVIAQKKG